MPDFANLAEGTDPNLLYDLEHRLEQVVEEHLQVTDNPRFAEFLPEELFRRYMEGVGREADGSDEVGREPQASEE